MYVGKSCIEVSCWGHIISPQNGWSICQYRQKKSGHATPLTSSSHNNIRFIEICLFCGGGGGGGGTTMVQVCVCGASGYTRDRAHILCQVITRWLLTINYECVHELQTCAGGTQTYCGRFTSFFILDFVLILFVVIN